MLVVALTPLDIVIAKDPTLIPALVRIFWEGIGLFVLSLFLEWLAGFLKKEQA